MSRFYECYIEVDGNTSAAEREVVNSYIGEVVLTGGEDDFMYSDRIAKEIWSKIGRFIPLDIRMTYMEELPYEEYLYSIEEYNEMMKGKENGSD